MRNYSFSLSLFLSLRSGTAKRLAFPPIFPNFSRFSRWIRRYERGETGGNLITRFEIPFQVQDTRCQLYVPFFSVYLKAHDEIYRAGNSPRSFFSFFFSLANILENSFETRLGGWRWMGRAGMGEKLGRGREKNFLIGRIVEQPSAQSYNFSIVSKLPDSFPRHSARARISDSKRTRDTGAIGIPLLRPVSS